jgi:hypothetical protein
VADPLDVTGAGVVAAAGSMGTGVEPSAVVVVASPGVVEPVAPVVVVDPIEVEPVVVEPVDDELVDEPGGGEVVSPEPAGLAGGPHPLGELADPPELELAELLELFVSDGVVPVVLPVVGEGSTVGSFCTCVRPAAFGLVVEPGFFLFLSAVLLAVAAEPSFASAPWAP